MEHVINSDHDYYVNDDPRSDTDTIELPSNNTGYVSLNNPEIYADKDKIFILSLFCM